MVNSPTVMASASYMATQLSINVHPGSGVPGLQYVYGQLLDVYGNPLEGKPVRLIINGADHGTETTYPDGGYGFTGVAVGGGVHVFLAVFDGDDVYDPSSAETSATFQKAQAALSLDVSPASGYVPLTITVRGYLRRSDTGAGLGARTVKIYKDGSPFAELKSSFNPADIGYYETADVLNDVNTHSYYAQFLGDDQFLGCGEPGDAERALGTPLATLLPVSSMFIGLILVAAGR